MDAMTKAQIAYDNLAEPEMDEDTADMWAWADSLTVTANDALEHIGRAERALRMGDLQACADLLTTAWNLMRDAE